MGLCCSKDAMPVVDSPADVKRKLRGADFASPVQFDFVARGAHGASLDGRRASTYRAAAAPTPDGGHSPEGGAYTPRELDATSIHSGTGTARTALSFLTNGTQDVSYDMVGRFVEKMREGSGSPLEGSMIGGSFATTTAASGGRMSREQRAYVHGAPDLRSRLARLAEVEESRRIEIVAAHRMTSMLFALAKQRIVPTVRRRRSTATALAHHRFHPATAADGDTGERRKRHRQSGAGGTSGCGAVPPVVVIHAKDIEIDFGPTHEGGDVGDNASLANTRNSDPGNLEVLERAHTQVGREDDEGVGAEPEYSPLVSPNQLTLPLSPTSPGVVEHYEMLALSAREVSITGDVKGNVVTSSWDFLSLPHTAAQLSAGEAFYRFVSKPCHQLDASSLDMLDMFVNVTSFENEAVENNAPVVNCADPHQLSKYVTILAKAMYVLPGVRLGSITKELLASLDYQRNCQAGETKFHDDVVAPFTFRQTKVIIKFLFSLVIQMKVSEITDPVTLSRFKDFDGIVPAKAILLERTKRDVRKVDSTAKCKSVLLYYPINDGVLVSHATIVLNTSLPSIISKVLDTFGGQGAKENADAARNTRRYMIHRFGDSREGLSAM